MPTTDRLDQLAADAAAGLKADGELYLDVTRELRTHLEETADAHARQGHDETESIDYAVQSFGSPLDVAADLQQANRPRMKLRATLRLAFQALVIPVAILLALYVGYGRFARLGPVIMGWLPQDDTVETLDLPMLPGYMWDFNIRTAQSKEMQPLFSNDAASVRRLWERHQNDPEAHKYYAYYIIKALSFGGVKARDLQQGEQFEPDNAMYGILLAQQYLSAGIKASAEKYPRKGQLLPDDLVNRPAFERGIAELQRAVRKPYLRYYHTEVVRNKLNALPPPVLTEDYVTRLSMVSAELLPHMSIQRNLAYKIPGCARLLIAQGRRREAEAVMDTWKPYARLLTRDQENYVISPLVARRTIQELSEEAEGVYRRLGAVEKARDARVVNERIMAAKWVKKHTDSAKSTTWAMHVSLLQRVVWPGYLEKYPNTAELMPGRMHEHTIFEEISLQLLLILLTIALLGTLLASVVWFYRLWRAAAAPLLLLPPARVLLGALCWGVLVPCVLYWLYARCPGLGERELGWFYRAPRFMVELLLLMGVLSWLPASLLRRYLRRRCDTLGIAVTKRRGVKVSREAKGLYYGTLARSMSLIYAGAILTLALAVQPWLLYQEAYWLKQDKLIFGYLTDRTAPTAGLSLPESRAADDYARQLRDALDPPCTPGGPHAE